MTAGVGAALTKKFSSPPVASAALAVRAKAAAADPTLFLGRFILLCTSVVIHYNSLTGKTGSCSSEGKGSSDFLARFSSFNQLVALLRALSVSSCACSLAPSIQIINPLELKYNAK